MRERRTVAPLDATTSTSRVSALKVLDVSAKRTWSGNAPVNADFLSAFVMGKSPKFD
jgi:hypothetical protein